MAKTFRTVGSGSAQTTEPIENNKIPIYDTKTDAESDLANLTVGQIIATKDEGNETSTPVDVVEDGNMHAVTSNAVADSCTRFPDYANPITITSGTTSWVATEDCYIIISQLFNYDASVEVYVDGNAVSVTDFQTDYRILTFNGYIKKGQRVYYDYLAKSNLCKIFPLI